MSRTRALIFALLTLAAAFLLDSGLLAGWPEGVRLALALAALVLLPGHALLTTIGALPPGGAWLASGWALGLGIAWLGLLILLTRIFHQPFTLLAPWGALPSAALWLLASFWNVRKGFLPLLFLVGFAAIWKLHPTAIV